MNIYIISRNGSAPYGEYFGFVIRAENPGAAQQIAIDSMIKGEDGAWPPKLEPDAITEFWTNNTNYTVSVLACDVQGAAGVVLTSFHHA
jgi:hypothetical protein